MVAEERAPAQIFDLLESAAATSPDNGMIYLEHGWDQKPTKVSHRELYEQAQVRYAQCVVVFGTDERRPMLQFC
jgi:hypothetical protein